MLDLINSKKKIVLPYTQTYAFGGNIRMSADKARRIIDQIRWRSYEETLMILELMPYRGCYPIFKLLYSAAANASHNKELDKSNLKITKAEVNESSTMKKLKPRARGRAYPIRRRTCNITLELTDISFYADLCKDIEDYYSYYRPEVFAKDNNDPIVYNTELRIPTWINRVKSKDKFKKIVNHYMHLSNRMCEEIWDKK